MCRLVLVLIVGFCALTPAQADEVVRCLTRAEQRAAIADGKAVPLATVLRALRRHPREVVRARLCQEPDRLVYRLTVLPRDGKVRRFTLDATDAKVVGER
jgi:uncharacterized membrane protein YkoI